MIKSENIGWLILGFLIGLVVNAVAVSVILHTFNPCQLCDLKGVLWQ